MKAEAISGAGASNPLAALMGVSFVVTNLSAIQTDSIVASQRVLMGEEQKVALESFTSLAGQSFDVLSQHTMLDSSPGLVGRVHEAIIEAADQIINASADRVLEEPLLEDDSLDVW